MRWCFNGPEIRAWLRMMDHLLLMCGSVGSVWITFTISDIRTVKIKISNEKEEITEKMEEEYEIQHYGFSIAELKKESKTKRKLLEMFKLQYFLDIKLKL